MPRQTKLELYLDAVTTSLRQAECLALLVFHSEHGNLEHKRMAERLLGTIRGTRAIAKEGK